MLMSNEINYRECPFCVVIENHEIERKFTRTIRFQYILLALQPQGKNNMLFYFEVDDLEGIFSRINNQVDLIHPIVRQRWGQQVFRFRDPDGHIIEIGEPMDNYSEWATYSGRYFNL